ncbi:MAG: hypothetical protein R3C05_26585 [Pirellulaceae bacterium]
MSPPFSQYFIEHGYSAEGLLERFIMLVMETLTTSDPGAAVVASSHAKLCPESSRNNIVADKQGRMRGPATEAADVPDETYADGAIADEAIKRLKSLSDAKQQPFFLAVGFVKPHLPLSCTALLGFI